MISTENYLKTIAPKQPFSRPEDAHLLTKIPGWVHGHPKTVMITRLALDILSLSAIVAAPIVWGGTGVILGVVGVIGILVTELAYRIFSELLPTPIGTHVFQQGKVEGGRLYTQGRIPILELDMADPYKAGRAQGKLLASEILQVFHCAKKTLDFPKCQEAVPDWEELTKLVPPDYLREMRGLVDGVNSWICEHSNYRKLGKITLEELVLFNLIPDSINDITITIKGDVLSLKDHDIQRVVRSVNSKEKKTSSANLACTVVVDKNERSGLVFGRNLDWSSFLGAGKYSLVINRKYKDNATVEIGMPGMIGTLTGMNQYGLSLAMNTCPWGIVKEEIPACFYNRMILEQCQNIEQTREFVDQHNPLSSYNLSVADEESAESYHFYQGEVLKNYETPHSEQLSQFNAKSFRFSYGQYGDKVRYHLHQRLGKKGPLVTTNGVHVSLDKKKYTDIDVNDSEKRKQNITELFAHAVKHVKKEEQDLEALVAYSQKLPYVNNSHTNHTVQMVPHKRLLRVSFDHSFAASHPLQELDARPLLGRP